jgi:hypothetical protein
LPHYFPHSSSYESNIYFTNVWRPARNVVCAYSDTTSHTNRWTMWALEIFQSYEQNCFTGSAKSDDVCLV